MNETVEQGRILKILLAEDSAKDSEIISATLTQSGYKLNIKCVVHEADFSSALSSDRFDVVLCDYRLPGFDAFRALQICKEISPNTPFICVSGTIGEETAIELIKGGAVDYVIIDHLARLPFAINRALDEGKEKEVRLHAEKSLKQKIAEMERFQNLTIGRELSMIELKKEVNQLLHELGRDVKYSIME
ncbi:MAG: response regulator [Bacteroidota bacterium]